MTDRSPVATGLRPRHVTGSAPPPGARCRGRVGSRPQWHRPAGLGLPCGAVRAGLRPGLPRTAGEPGPSRIPQVFGQLREERRVRTAVPRRLGQQMAGLHQGGAPPPRGFGHGMSPGPHPRPEPAAEAESSPDRSGTVRPGSAFRAVPSERVSVRVCRARLASPDRPGFLRCSTSSARSAAFERPCRVGSDSRRRTCTRAARRSRTWRSVRGGGAVTGGRGGSAGRPRTPQRSRGGGFARLRRVLPPARGGSPPSGVRGRCGRVCGGASARDSAASRCPPVERGAQSGRCEQTGRLVGVDACLAARRSRGRPRGAPGAG
ncbi:hypothetical protein SHL15_5926 [Streptomyces hygroscopicus subsp. limoneus]|nr:hypothetical protein SHL15_5926 [Streptomyces hygroscopicus subsp. limoneus]